jgi:2,4-dienoyl-CoA reductase-like NADH-dependent reductase (Old Yellow Enzyme family)
MSVLFSPLDIGPVRAPNRLAIAPMCQYSANDGCASDWDLHQIMSYAMSGAGVVTLEATGVQREGRISLGCLGLYSDETEYALTRVMQAARAVAMADTRFSIQLCHAGRKGSTHKNWDGGAPLQAHESGWRTSAPSAVPFSDNWPAPDAMSEDEIERTIKAFGQAAARAARIGFDMVA